MQRFDTFVGALRYEFRMQIRRRSVWITFIALGLFFIVFHQPWYRPITTPAGDALVYWTGEVQSFLAIAVGILLADRLPRDRRTKVEEVLDTLPGAPGARVFGKYLGSTLATLVLMFAVYCVGVGYIISRWHDVQALPIALATFAAIVLPGILFIGAFSIACPAILWVPLYQFLFVGYWFWGNALSPTRTGIPTLSQTILTPIGTYISAGMLGVSQVGLVKSAPFWEGLASLLLLLGTAVFVLSVLWRYLSWQQARQ